MDATPEITWKDAYESLRRDHPCDSPTMQAIAKHWAKMTAECIDQLNKLMDEKNKNQPKL